MPSSTVRTSARSGPVRSGFNDSSATLARKLPTSGTGIVRSPSQSAATNVSRALVGAAFFTRSNSCATAARAFATSIVRSPEYANYIREPGDLAGRLREGQKQRRQRDGAGGSRRVRGCLTGLSEVEEKWKNRVTRKTPG